MSELARLQARFAAGLLTAGDDPADLFRGEAARTARRFALYRGNLTANWDRGLGNAYPVLRKLVGDEFFRAMAREFGRATPLVEGDLNHLGADLASFLEQFASLADYPYLPDMARLEWALHQAHYAQDSPALSLAVLAEMDADTLEGLRPHLREPCKLLRSPWAIKDIWQAHQPGGPPWPEDIAQLSHYLVCRPRWRAEVLALSPGEFAALQAIDDGGSLGAALEAATDADPDFDPAPALPRWLQAGIFSADRTTEAHRENTR